MKFTCRVCTQEHDESNRHKGTAISSKGFGRCKKCHSNYVREHQLMRRAKISPQNYSTCLDCDKVFHYTLKCCPECKSTNFDDYIS